MADVYIADSVFAQYVAEHGTEDAKTEIRNVVKQHAPEDTHE